MSCVSPIEAWRSPYGGVQFGCVGSTGRLLLPCGQCIECRLARSGEWAVRCVHEAKLHRRNAFITLTYSDDSKGLSLDYHEFQLFLRRARKELGPLRYLCAGEYGEENRRAHFHALLFGVDFPDRYFFKRSPSGEIVYRSPVLESLWKDGFSSCGDLTYQSAAYVARYVVKKVNGDGKAEAYQRVTEFGELVEVEPEFGRMSLNPGIGARFWEKYHAEITVRDSVILGGVEHPVPRYYNKLWERQDPEGYKEAKEARRALRERGENAPARLLARKAVAEARLAFKKRGKV